MKAPWLDVLVLVVIAVGAASVARSSLTRRDLQAEVERLEKITGRLSIDDPSRVYIRAMETDDPLEFAWRMYFPKGYRYVFGEARGGTSSGSHSDAMHFIGRVRIREIPDGLYVYRSFGGSSSLGGQSKVLAGFMRDRWDKMRIEQFAKDQQESLDAKTGSAALIRLVPTEELLREAADEKLPPNELYQLTPSFAEIRLGTPTSKP